MLNRVFECHRRHSGRTICKHFLTTVGITNAIFVGSSIKIVFVKNKKDIVILREISDENFRFFELRTFLKFCPRIFINPRRI